MIVVWYRPIVQPSLPPKRKRGPYKKRNKASLPLDTEYDFYSIFLVLTKNQINIWVWYSQSVLPSAPPKTKRAYQRKKKDSFSTQISEV